jgi:hypothetical protein
VSGTIQEAGVPATDSVGQHYVITSDAGVSQAQVGALITNVANACSVLQRQGNPPSATSLEIVVTALGTSVATGTYTIVPQGGYGATASYTTEDDDCNTTLSETATGGTVTLTTASSSSVAGTFDLTFDTDHVTGSFSAPVCSYTEPADASACM